MTDLQDTWLAATAIAFTLGAIVYGFGQIASML